MKNLVVAYICMGIMVGLGLFYSEPLLAAGGLICIALISLGHRFIEAVASEDQMLIIQSRLNEFNSRVTSLDTEQSKLRRDVLMKIVDLEAQLAAKGKSHNPFGD